MAGLACAKAQRQEAGAGVGLSMEGRSTLNAKEEVWAVFQRISEGAVAASEGW